MLRRRRCLLISALAISEQKWHVPVYDIKLIVAEVNHVEHVLLLFLFKNYVHEFHPYCLRVLHHSLSRLRVHEVELQLSLKLRLVLLVIEEVLQLVLVSFLNQLLHILLMRR